MTINPTMIRRQSRTQRVIRFWVLILVQTVVLFAVMFLIGLAVMSLNAAVHPVDYNVQLPLQPAYEGN